MVPKCGEAPDQVVKTYDAGGKEVAASIPKAVDETLSLATQDGSGYPVRGLLSGSGASIRFAV